MLKNVLSLLLSRFYSKKDAAEIAALALPNHLDGIAISITEGTNTYIAPADGYINFVTARNGGVNVYGQCLQTNSYPSTNRQAKAFVPISKGKQIIFEIGGENISATFYKLVGGGYQTLKKLLLQGGVLCRLSRLCNSLRKSSLSVRRHGSATSLRPSYQGARKSPLSLAPILKTTQRRATELYVSILLTLRGQSSALLLIAGGAYFTARTKQEFIKCSRFLSQRVKRSTLISQRIKAPLISSSFRPLVLNEVKGGVSC